MVYANQDLARREVLLFQLTLIEIHIHREDSHDLLQRVLFGFGRYASLICVNPVLDLYQFKIPP
jgi:hypothetical protein